MQPARPAYLQTPNVCTWYRFCLHACKSACTFETLALSLLVSRQLTNGCEVSTPSMQRDGWSQMGAQPYTPQLQMYRTSYYYLFISMMGCAVACLCVKLQRQRSRRCCLSYDISRAQIFARALSRSLSLSPQALMGGLVGFRGNPGAKIKARHRF